MTKEDMVKAIIYADITCPELKTAAENYLKSVNTDKESNYAKVLIAEAEEDLMTNEEVIKFFSSQNGKKILGNENAERLRIHHESLIENGVKYCDCSACTAAKRLIDNKEMFLKFRGKND